MARPWITPKPARRLAIAHGQEMRRPVSLVLGAAVSLVLPLIQSAAAQPEQPSPVGLQAAAAHSVTAPAEYKGADAAIQLAAGEQERRNAQLGRMGLVDGLARAKVITSGVSVSKKSKGQWEWSVRARAEITYPLPRSNARRWYILVQQGDSCSVQLEAPKGPDAGAMYWRVIQTDWGRPAIAVRPGLPKPDDENEPAQRRVINALETKAAKNWAGNLPAPPRVTICAEDTGVLELKVVRARLQAGSPGCADVECTYVPSKDFPDAATFLAKFQPLLDTKVKRDEFESAIAEKMRRGPDESDLRRLEDQLLRVEQEIAELDSTLDKPHEEWARQEYVRKRDAKRQERIELLQKIDDAKRHIGKK